MKVITSLLSGSRMGQFCPNGLPVYIKTFLCKDSFYLKPLESSNSSRTAGKNIFRITKEVLYKQVQLQWSTSI